jgi:hypothetical protein
MRLTIIPSDGMVLVDGRACKLDLTGYSQLDGLRAVQWDEDLGHIEFDNRRATPADYKHNENITDIDAYQDIVAAWQAAAAAEDTAMAEMKAKAQLLPAATSVEDVNAWFATNVTSPEIAMDVLRSLVGQLAARRLVDLSTL